MKMVICLGRFGDIVNILPLLREYDRKGERAALMVAKEFASLLDGVGYVEKVIWDGDWMDVRGAYELASKTGREVRVWQLAGDSAAVKELAYGKAGLTAGMAMAESFAKEQWRVAGALHLWREKLPLVFDKRNEEREHEAWLDLGSVTTTRTKRVILVSLSGKTSPYPHAELLRMLIEGHFPVRHYDIVDLDQIKLEKVYDAVGLIQRAFCLVASDSAFLHLAHATETPVAALIQDFPSLWHGSPWRPHHVSHVRYSDVAGLPRLIRAVKAIGGPGSLFSLPGYRSALAGPIGQRLIHVWSTMDVIDNTTHEVAAKTWEKLYRIPGAISLAITPGLFGRDAQTQFQDPKDRRRFPFVRDVLRAACEMCEKDGDYIILSRAECCLNATEIQELVKAPRPWVGARVVKGQRHAGGDVFAFTRAWWRKNQEKYPDIVLGLDAAWHRVLFELLIAEGAVLTEAAAWRTDLSVQQTQESSWRSFNGSQASAWLKNRNIADTFKPVAKVLNTMEVNPAGLFRWGYNPGLAKLGDDYLMPYRAHRHGDRRTNLAVARLDRRFKVKSNDWIEFGDGLSYEDPRFFWHAGGLWICYIRSEWPHRATSEVVIGQLGREGGRYFVAGKRSIQLPDKPRQMEKNWLFFEHDERLFFVYSQAGEQIVMETQNYTVTDVHRTPLPAWRWGTMRGGTSPLRFSEGKLVRLFHSRTDFDFAPITWRYHLGAVVMDGKPPFAVERISGEPIVSASHEDVTVDRDKCPHHKPAIVFPCGWIETEEGWLVSLGINDNSCHLAHLTRKQLKLT